MRNILSLANVSAAAALGAIVAIGCSDMVAGFCLRAALATPAVWAGLIDIETGIQFVVR